MIKKTYKEIVELDSMVGGLFQKTPDLRLGKFGYAYKRFYEKNFKTPLSEYNEELAMIRIDNASIDENTKVLLTEPTGRGFKYGKEGLKAVLKAERKLEDSWFAKEFDIEPYFIKPENLPEGLTDEQKELMQGILIE